MAQALTICGDSFNIGIGCRDLINEPYGILLSKQLNKPLINLAKGSSTNLSIFLQARYAVENLDTDLVIVSPTSYDRVEWFPLDYEFRDRELSLQDVNYHEYPPYGVGTYMQQLPNPLANDPEYTGAMFTENYSGVLNYWDTFVGPNRDSGEYYKKFHNEDHDRIKALYDFARLIHEPRINRLYTIGMMTMAHQLLKSAGIKHLILTHEVPEYGKFIDSNNILDFSWGQLSLDYPDDLPSWHTSALGHVRAAEIVITRLKENGWT
jgi:hypothetical protein